MKKVLIVILVIVAVLMAALAGFEYKTRYHKTEITESFSPDERYTLKIYMVGEPEWPFGATHCRYDLLDGKKTISKYSDTIHNDGGNALPEDFEIYWKDDCVSIIVHGEEQDDKAVTLYFDGRSVDVTDEPIKVDQISGDAKSLQGFDDERQIIDIYRSYAEINGVDGIDTTDVVKSKEIISELVMLYGSNHFPAVDAKNKVDMVSREYLEEFCRKVISGEGGSQTLISIDSPRRIIRYGFDTLNSKVTVHKTWYEFADETVGVIDNVTYEAEKWDAGDDYLMFSGSYEPEELFVLTLSDGEECDAIRMAPLDSKCRELTEIDALKIGYESNNVFMTDWDENNQSGLDTDDIFEYLCRSGKVDLGDYTYETDEDGNNIYYIPEKVYEESIQSIIDIEGDELKERYNYNPCFRAYAFRMRGIEEVESPEYPYPEVIAYEEQGDGRLSLTVNAVYAAMGTDEVLTCETVVRPVSEGSYVICSNKVIEKDEEKLIWHTDRIPTELSYEGDFIITQKDIARLDEIALAFGSEHEETLSSNGEPEAVLASSSESKDEKCYVPFGGEMNNGHILEDFYNDYKSGKKSEAQVFELRDDGTYSMTAFLCKDGKVNTYFANVEKDKSGKLIVTVSSVNIVDSLVLTPKKYFIYGLRYLIEHASLRDYWRLYPLSVECKEYTEKFIKGMNFETYNLFITDWTKDNVESILMDGLFDDLYWKDTGEIFKLEGDDISEVLFEDIMTRYLPVTVEQLREKFDYNPMDKTYKYKRVFGGSAYAPFGEVVDYKENSNGSLDLIVDGVWPDYDSDCGFRCYVTVEPDAAGSFMYLSNSVVPMELSVPKLSLY